MRARGRCRGRWRRWRCGGLDRRGRHENERRCGRRGARRGCGAVLGHEEGRLAVQDEAFGLVEGQRDFIADPGYDSITQFGAAYDEKDFCVSVGVRLRQAGSERALGTRSGAEGGRRTVSAGRGSAGTG